VILSVTELQPDDENLGGVKQKQKGDNSHNKLLVPLDFCSNI